MSTAPLILAKGRSFNLEAARGVYNRLERICESTMTSKQLTVAGAVIAAIPQASLVFPEHAQLINSAASVLVALLGYVAKGQVK